MRHKKNNSNLSYYLMASLLGITVKFFWTIQTQYNVTFVQWKNPPIDTSKLNTDGSVMHNPSRIGGGGILRDYQGKLVYAFSIPLSIGTNNNAENKAALQGIYWC